MKMIQNVPITTQTAPITKQTHKHSLTLKLVQLISDRSASRELKNWLLTIVFALPTILLYC